MSDNRLNVEGLTVNNIVADKIQTRSIEILSDGASSDGEGVSKNIFGSDVKVAARPYENNLTKLDNNGTITNSNSVAIISKDGKEDNIIIHRNPAGITSSPYISIESHNNGASLTLKDSSELANDVYGDRGGFELKAGTVSLKGETSGDLTWNDVYKLKSNGRLEILPEKTNSGTFGFDHTKRTGGLIALRGNDYTDNPGGFEIFARNESQGVILQGKCDGTLTWNSKPVITLTKSWISGGNWYRQYSDGWIEQSGVIDGANNAFSTVTLYLAFKDTNYTILLTQGGTNTSADRVSQYQSKTTTSFKASRDDVSTAIRWYACGF